MLCEIHFFFSLISTSAALIRPQTISRSYMYIDKIKTYTMSVKVLGLFLCSLLLSNLLVFEISGSSDGVSILLYTSAAIFFFPKTKTKSFCNCSDIAVRLITLSLHQRLCNRFLVFRICSQKGENQTRVLTNLNAG